jgi:hypothetical protein
VNETSSICTSQLVNGGSCCDSVYNAPAAVLDLLCDSRLDVWKASHVDSQANSSEDYISHQSGRKIVRAAVPSSLTVDGSTKRISLDALGIVHVGLFHTFSLPDSVAGTRTRVDAPGVRKGCESDGRASYGAHAREVRRLGTPWRVRGTHGDRAWVPLVRAVDPVGLQQEPRRWFDPSPFQTSS